jgi:Na+-driven multidrug efflux pump
VALLRDDLERRIVRLALPALGTLAVEPLYVLVDTAIVGRLGTSPLAGLALAATVLLTVVSLFNFLEYGVTPDIAFLHGAGRPHDARQAATDALWLACLLGIPTAIALGLAARPLASALGGHGAVLAAATTYLRISAVGLPFVLLVLLGHGVMRGVNDLRRPLLIVVVANVANVVLEIIVGIAPLLGLVGTILGMISVFGDVGKAGLNDAAKLAHRGRIAGDLIGHRATVAETVCEDAAGVDAQIGLHRLQDVIDERRVRGG